MRDLESLPDPKQMLHDLLRKITGHSRRRPARFNVGLAVQRMSELIEDYSRLRQLKALRAFEKDVARYLESL